jgi:outer membrane protein, heavy metal efflux system
LFYSRPLVFMCSILRSPSNLVAFLTLTQPRFWQNVVVKFTKLVLIIFCSLWLGLQTPANATDNYFEVLYQQALKTNPDLKVIQKQLALSQADVISAGYIPNPSLQFTWGWGKTTSQLGNPQQIGVQQVIELGPKRQLRRQLAKTQVDGALIAIRQFSWVLHSNLRLAYIDYLSAQSQVEQMQRQAQLFDHLSSIAQARADAGAAPQSEALQAKLARQQLTPHLIQAKGQLKQATFKLYQWLGLNPDERTPVSVVLGGTLSEKMALMEAVPHYTPSSLSSSTQDNTLAQLQKIGHDYRQELKTAYNQLQQSRLALKQSQWQQLPDPQLGGSFLFVHSLSPLASSLSDKTTIMGGCVSLNFPLPVFHNQQAEIARSKTQISVNEQTVQATAFSIDSALRQSVTAIQTQQDALKIFRTQLIPESAEVLKLADIGYRFGKTGLVSVILARQTYQSVQTDYLNTLTQTWQAWAGLEQQTGLPLELLLEALAWPQNQPIYKQPALPLLPASAAFKLSPVKALIVTP